MTRDELDAIKARIPKYGGGDMRALVAEVERLRADVVRRQELCDAYQSECEAANSALLESEADARGNAEACIVAWLRRRRLDTLEYDGTDNAVSLTLAVTADRIERGEHRREEQK